jgi:iron complex outermembrane receptor protein
MILYSQNQAGTQQPFRDLNQLSLAELGDVKVTTASKEPEQVWRTPAAVYVLTQDDIHRSGATSIPELLRLVPGVEVGRIDSDHWSIGIRGFESGFSKYVLVLIDGRSVYTPLFEGVYWDVQNVLLEDVDRVEVIRGPGGTIWGANAVNGVINIITKHASETHGTQTYISGGNIDQAGGTVRYGGRMGGKLDYRLYAMGGIRGAEFHPDKDPFDESRLGQVGFRADWGLGNRDKFALQGDLYSGENGERVGVGFFSPPSQVNVDGTAFVSGGHLLAHWRRQLGGESDVQVQAYFDRTNRQDVQLGETRNIIDFDFIHHFASAPRQDVIWGLGARLSPSNFIQTQSTVDFSPHRQTDSIYSGFLQDQFSLKEDKLFLTVGSKVEHNNYNGFDYQPSVRFLWRPGPRTTLWAAGTRALRTPSRLDRDLSLTGYAETVQGYPLFVSIVGNPKYAPERMIGYEAGSRSLLGSRFYLDISTYFNNYNGLTSYGAAAITIQQAPSPSSYLYILITEPWANGLLGNTDGVEMSPDWKLNERLEVKGSYSYAQMHLKDRPGITDTGTAISDVGSSPRHQLVVQSLLSLPHRLEFDPTYRYVSSLPAQSVKSYSTMDLHLGWSFAERLQLSAACDNLLQPHHIEFGGDPGPLVGVRRSAYLRLTWLK